MSGGVREAMSYVIRKVKDANPKDITCGILRSLTSSKEFKEIDFAHITITDSTKKHYHNKLTEFYYILDGSINIELDGKTESLERGSLIIIRPKTKHKAWKTSKENAELLVVCCPPWSEEDEILVE